MMEKNSYRPPETTRHFEDYYAEFNIDQDRNVELSSSVKNMFAHAEMYRLPGDPDLSKRDFARFQTSNERLRVDLEKRVKNDPICAVDVSDEEAFSFLDKDAIISTLKAQLESKDKRYNLRAVFNFLNFSPDIQKKFYKHVEVCIDKHIDSVARLMVGEVKTLMPIAEKISPKLYKKIRSKVHSQINEVSKNKALAFSLDLSYGLIPFADESVQVKAAHEALEFFSDDPYRLEQLSSLLARINIKCTGYWVFQSGIVKKVDNCLTDSAYLQYAEKKEALTAEILRLIPIAKYINPQDRQIFFKKFLEHQNIDIRWKAVQEIEQLPHYEQSIYHEEKIAVLLDIFDTYPTFDLYMWGACEMVLNLGAEQQKKFFSRISDVIKKTVLQRYNPETNAVLAQLAGILPHDQQGELWELLVVNTLEALKGEHSAVYDSMRSGAATFTRYIPNAYQHKIVDAVVTSLEKNYPAANFYKEREIKQTLSCFPPEIQGEILNKKASEGKADTAKIRKQAATTPLYKNKPEHFFTRSFEKDGSETTLLGKVPGDSEKSLKEQVILRHITPGAYDVWKKIYQDVDFWHQQGFKYVPVEPIVSVRLDKNDPTVTVATRVLRGPSMYTWRESPGMFMKEIEQQRERILSALKKIRYEHGLGHNHEGNFVLMFERSKNDEILIDRPPRLYLIDFDQGSFKQNVI